MGGGEVEGRDGGKGRDGRRERQRRESLTNSVTYVATKHFSFVNTQKF